MNFSRTILRTFLTVILIGIFSPLSAQDKSTLRGKITSGDSNDPLTGATITVEGGGIVKYAISDSQGLYEISQLPAGKYKLTASFVGSNTEERQIELDGHKDKQIDIRLSDNLFLDGVVVTSLGIKRAEKALGYATSSVEIEEIESGGADSWATALSGKVAGLNIEYGASGPGGSVRINLRGEGSLDASKNQALIVVDGIPYDNSPNASNSNGAYENDDAPIDYGGGLADINPDEIASMSVLKGAAATALYGSRAANGAIVITTKGGKSTKGLGVTVKSGFVAEEAGYFPDFQDTYGAGNISMLNLVGGTTPLYGEYSFWNVEEKDQAGNVINNVKRNTSTQMFGMPYDNSLVYLYRSRNWDDGTYTRYPYKPEDWYKGFFKTGLTFTNSVSISGGNGKGASARLTISDKRNNWIVPNTGYNQQSVNFSGDLNINKWITLSSKVIYTHKGSDNLPISGYTAQSPLKLLIWNNPQVSVADLYDEYRFGRIGYVYENNKSESWLVNKGSNPYFVAYEHINTLDRNRVTGNVSAKVWIIPGRLDVKLSASLDTSDEFATQRKPFYSTRYLNGFYREQRTSKYEHNIDFMITYRDSFGDFDVNAMFGGSHMKNKYNRYTTTARKLYSNNLFMLSNCDGDLLTNSYRSEKVINGFYGLASLSWRDQIFLEFTARNDWSSTLPLHNNSYFYPSVNLSVLLHEILDFRNKASWVDYLKVRGSWANVGNDTSPYNLYDLYSQSNVFDSAYGVGNSVKNADLKPENVRSWEAGLEAKFLKNRLGFDVTFYDNTTYNQIISVPSDMSSGASSKLINAGNVNNRGLEIMAYFVPLDVGNWMWRVTMNWSKNWNTLRELAPGVERWQMNSSNDLGGRIFIYAAPGQDLGQIYASGYHRAPEGAFYLDDKGNKIDCSGEIVVDKSSGNPVYTNELLNHGSVFPDWKGGMTHSLKWRFLTLSAAFSWQIGGKAYSVTDYGLSTTGKLKNTLEGRYDGFVFQGVNLNEDGTYSKNRTITADVVDCYHNYIYTQNNIETSIHDTSFLKLKQLSLSYTMNRKTLKKSKVFKGFKVSIFATNLFCITDWPQYDPEAVSFGAGLLSRGVETGAYPMTRTYGGNITLTF